ncbi:Ribosomal RNA large subunit methyltransferase E [Candidatus Vampirococcus lugosii]|uniref:Ribosomal RNA large subunit methyltransferase E n=2 Tax=Candidatus Vampirococcus lugosii TaxID=2789015 RepID=A0ABS5QKQ0_9BACT|nr:Ribosomal RNA large subunit methyltransferase E [Candidatus Vampirococcus lugosii]
MYNPYDYYFKKAKKSGYKARSVFKLEEIDQKFNLFDKTIKKVLDIGCSPGSWIQYTWNKINNNLNYKIIGFDLKEVSLNLENVFTYKQDISDFDNVQKILKESNIEKFDIIISDMAPDTTGIKDLDAIKSIALIEKTLPIYKKYLGYEGKFVIKIFMGPGFEEFLSDLKKIYGSKSIKTFKPKSTRKESKEIYIIKI